MRIVVVGASGDIGRAVCAELGERHELITAGRTSGDIHVDITDGASIEAMYSDAGVLDAVITTVGDVHFGPVAGFTEDQMMTGLKHKAMGQINVVLLGLPHLKGGGSFTVTSGILNRDPIRQGVGAATANGALDGFVTGASIEMPRGLRINAVSPGLLDVSVNRYGAWFPDHEPVAANRVGLAYAKSVEGGLTGKVLCVD